MKNNSDFLCTCLCFELEFLGLGLWKIDGNSVNLERGSSGGFFKSLGSFRFSE